MPEFNVGDKVQFIGDLTKVGLITAIGRRRGNLQYYEVFWGGAGDQTSVPGESLRHYRTAEKPGENLVEGNLGGWRDFQRLLTLCRLLRDQPLQNHLYAFNASRTQFFPYQFKPLLKFLDSLNQRLLIADEVGLGKTIEAGLILVELQARQDVRRVLVVCPANLTAKWRLELRRRFGLEFRIMRAPDVLGFLDEYVEEQDRLRLFGIVSMETLRGSDIQTRFGEVLPDLDLVIVDEAHHMRNFNLTRRAGTTLSIATQASGGLLLLTATPVHLGSRDLFSLLNLLDPDGFPDEDTAQLRFRDNEPILLAQRHISNAPPRIDEALAAVETAGRSRWLREDALVPVILQELRDLSSCSAPQEEMRRILVRVQRHLSDINLLGHVLTRTRKRDAQIEFPERRARAIELEFSKEEQEFYDAVTEFSREQARASGYDPVIIQWVMNMPQRQIASCIPAMVERFRNQSMPVSDFDDEEFEQNGYADGFARARSRLAEAQERLREIIEAWPANAVDTKYEHFRQVLESVTVENKECKVMVFSFFKATLHYLFECLRRDGVRAVVITGDVAPEDRPGLISQFQNDPTLNVMLSSRVGSEGLDFQFCHVMVNYDFPWNPMEVEQRIGRLDRIGQRSPVILIYNFWIRGTIEERILRRLYDRIKIFERSIGDLEVIVGETIAKLERDIFVDRLSPEEEARRVEQAARVLEDRMQELERLEQNSAKFIGTDQFFREEIDTIRETRGYTTPRQMYIFTLDFIEKQCPGTIIRKVTGEGDIYEIVADNALESIARKHNRAVELSSFFSGGRNRGVRVTFDSEVAFSHPEVEFLNVLHPLVRVIADELQEDSSQLLNASRFVLRTRLVPSGVFFYFIFLLQISGARPQNRLEIVLSDPQGRIFDDTSVLKKLLGTMIENGEEISGIVEEVSLGEAQRAYDQAIDFFLSRVELTTAEERRHNDALVSRRIASLETSYLRKMDGVRDVIRRGEVSGYDESYLRMPRGKLARLEQEWAERREKLNRQRAVHVDFREVAAGVLYAEEQQ